jgi:hypothetical protein
MTSSNRCIAALVLGVLMLVAACGGSPELLEGEQELTLEELPLESRLPWRTSGTSDLLPIEEAIELCMKREGFEYFVPPPELAGSSAAQQRKPFTVSRDEFTSRGFGFYESVAEAPPPEDETKPTLDDGNSAYVATLDDAAATAYWAALLGDNSGTTGCRAEAQSQYVTPKRQEVLDRLRTEVGELTESALNHPVVADERLEIFRCLGRQGYEVDQSYSYPEDAASQAAEQWLEAFYEDDESEPVSDAPVDGPSSEALEELRQKEIALAETLWDCGYPDFLQAFWAERAPLEEQFLETQWLSYVEELSDA